MISYYNWLFSKIDYIIKEADNLTCIFLMIHIHNQFHAMANILQFVWNILEILVFIGNYCWKFIKIYRDSVWNNKIEVSVRNPLLWDKALTQFKKILFQENHFLNTDLMSQQLIIRNYSKSLLTLTYNAWLMRSLTIWIVFVLKVYSLYL